MQRWAGIAEIFQGDLLTRFSEIFGFFFKNSSLQHEDLL